MISKTLMFMAMTGQTITKNTGVSIVLVIGLVVATVAVTTAFNTVENDISNLKKDVNEIKVQQDKIYTFIQNHVQKPPDVK